MYPDVKPRRKRIGINRLFIYSAKEIKYLRAAKNALEKKI
jgi:hypothetical protein